MAISPQQLTIYLYSAHRAVIFAIAQLSCKKLLFVANNEKFSLRRVKSKKASRHLKGNKLQSGLEVEDSLLDSKLRGWKEKKVLSNSYSQSTNTAYIIRSRTTS